MIGVEDSDMESIISINEFGADLCQLFNSENSQKLGRAEEFSVHSLNKKVIP